MERGCSGTLGVPYELLTEKKLIFRQIREERQAEAAVALLAHIIQVLTPLPFFRTSLIGLVKKLISPTEPYSDLVSSSINFSDSPFRFLLCSLVTRVYGGELMTRVPAQPLHHLWQTRTNSLRSPARSRSGARRPSKTVNLIKRTSSIGPMGRIGGRWECQGTRKGLGDAAEE